MGTDKALIEFRGQPLIAHALRILRQAGLPALIAGARSELSSFAPVIDDVDSSQGPLAGICSALTANSASWLVFVPVDLPLLPPALLSSLLECARLTGRPVTLASVAGFAQTFPCVLDRAVLSALRAELDAQRGGCFSAFQAAALHLGQALGTIPVELLAQTGQVSHPEGLPAARWFFNLNSRADIACAESFRAELGT